MDAIDVKSSVVSTPCSTAATAISLGEMMIAVFRATMFGLVFLACLAGSVAPSSAADYPNRPVRWLIGFTAGGRIRGRIGGLEARGRPRAWRHART
jgi:hypothetical protein